MAEIRDDIEKSFDELGVTYDDQVIKRCLDICNKHNVNDAEEFVDTWMAYSVSHFKGANPTLAYLNRFERDEYIKKVKDSTPAVADTTKKSLVIYEAKNVERESENRSDYLNAYNTTPKGAYVSDRRRTTPENGAKRSRGTNPSATPTSQHIAFSPASFSPAIATQSTKYASRTNAGEVVLKFNESEKPWNWKAAGDYTARVEVDVTSDIKRFMHFDLVDCLDRADENIDYLGSILCQKFSLEEQMPTRYKHPSQFVTVGRIACDCDGRLNSKSVMLEGSREVSSGEAVQLDLSGVSKYSIFPGQVVAVEGFNTTGDKLVGKQVYSDVPPCEPFPVKLANGPMCIVLASGPFTQSDSMIYQPLLDLVELVAENEPHVLILTGPLIDSKHPFVVENAIAETYQELFGKLVDQIMRPLEGKRTHVILSSSYKDCHGPAVYPTPKFSPPSKSYSKLHLIGDPCFVTIEGVKIGITSTDILMHLGKEEISCPPHSSDRLSRLAGHIMSQRSFYPLSPPALEVPLDPTLMDYTKITEIPHVLVLPSDLRYFIKEVSGCLVVNPERLAKGVIGGTYASLLISSEGITGQVVKI